MTGSATSSSSAGCSAASTGSETRIDAHSGQMRLSWPPMMICSSSAVERGAWQCGQTIRIMLASLNTVIIYSTLRTAIRQGTAYLTSPLLCVATNPGEPCPRYGGQGDADRRVVARRRAGRGGGPQSLSSGIRAVSAGRRAPMRYRIFLMASLLPVAPPFLSLNAPPAAPIRKKPRDRHRPRCRSISSAASMRSATGISPTPGGSCRRSTPGWSRTSIAAAATSAPRSISPAPVTFRARTRPAPAGSSGSRGCPPGSSDSSASAGKTAGASTAPTPILSSRPPRAALTTWFPPSAK